MFRVFAICPAEDAFPSAISDVWADRDLHPEIGQRTRHHNDIVSRLAREPLPCRGLFAG